MFAPSKALCVWSVRPRVSRLAAGPEPKTDTCRKRLMASQRCPQCRASMSRLLPEISRAQSVSYYVCEKCRHAWNVSKNDPDGRPVPVTVLRQTPETK